MLPKFVNANAANDLGSFAEGETGIELCAIIDGGNEDALRFYVSSDQGFSSDVIVTKDSCRTIETSAANYRIRQYVPQEYVLESVSGGTVNADDTSFVATSTGQYAVIYKNTFASKPYLHTFGYTSSNTTATAVGVKFDANGGEGTMNEQFFGLNSQQNLAFNAFTREKYNFTGWNTKADGTGETMLMAKRSLLLLAASSSSMRSGNMSVARQQISSRVSSMIWAIMKSISLKKLSFPTILQRQTATASINIPRMAKTFITSVARLRTITSSGQVSAGKLCALRQLVALR